MVSPLAGFLICGLMCRLCHETQKQKSRSVAASSNSLIYLVFWCRWAESNCRPSHYECAALPTELQRHQAKPDHCEPRIITTTPHFVKQLKHFSDTREALANGPVSVLRISTADEKQTRKEDRVCHACATVHIPAGAQTATGIRSEC